MINDADSGVLLEWLEAARKNKMPESLIVENFTKILKSPPSPQQTPPPAVAPANLPVEGRTIQRTEVAVEQPKPKPQSQPPAPVQEPEPEPEAQTEPEPEKQEPVPPPPTATKNEKEKKKNKDEKEKKPEDDKKKGLGLPRLALKFKIFKDN
jgi:hypothetical protein